jgi:hypothetical protein
MVTELPVRVPPRTAVGRAVPGAAPVRSRRCGPGVAHGSRVTPVATAHFDTLSHTSFRYY